MYILDIEIYPNYFLLCAKNFETHDVKIWEIKNDLVNFNVEEIRDFMCSNITVTFNGSCFDLLLISYLLKGAGVSKLKSLSDAIINSPAQSWVVANEFDIVIPSVRHWRHVDLMYVAPQKASLKLYAARLGVESIVNLPYDPNQFLSLKEIDVVRDYCLNDLNMTHSLYKSLVPQLKLRLNLAKAHNINSFYLMSKSDAQLAEIIIKNKYTAMGGSEWIAGNKRLPATIDFKYNIPHFINFKLPQLSELLKDIKNATFSTNNYNVKLPEFLTNKIITINDINYKMGIGGLHSMEKDRYINCLNKNKLIFDLDVASYYPSIILNQKLYPKNLGEKYLGIYRRFVEERLRAKKIGDKVTSDALKIAVNGGFGKYGSKYSALYSPELLVQITLTGQLALLMMIEYVTRNDYGCTVISANTDGLTCLLDNNLNSKKHIERCIKYWQKITGFILERTEYKLLASRDVNNYVALKDDGTLKTKGVFAASSLSKNPVYPICYEAAAKYICHGVDIDDTLFACTDILKFCLSRRVSGGATWNNLTLGKVVRFYYSNVIDKESTINYLKSGNKVPLSDGARPLMSLSDDEINKKVLPYDLDFVRYRNITETIISDCGVW